MTEEQLLNIVEAITEIEIDNTVPKNIKRKLGETSKILRGTEEDESIRISKAKDILQEVLDDQNMQSYTRTQLLNLLSGLEMIF